MSEVETFLEHFGVKGMKWGRKKAEGTSPGLGSAPPGIPQKRMSRKEVKAYNKQAEQEFYSKKMSDIFDEVQRKGEDVLVSTRMQGDYAVTIATGKQVAEHLMAGGAMDAKSTEIFARLDKKSNQFVQNVNPVGGYTKVKR